MTPPLLVSLDPAHAGVLINSALGSPCTKGAGSRPEVCERGVESI